MHFKNFCEIFCRFNPCHFVFRLVREAGAADSFSSRILIITGSDNECDKYVRFMNIIFTAQKQVR